MFGLAKRSFSYKPRLLSQSLLNHIRRTSDTYADSIAKLASPDIDQIGREELRKIVAAAEELDSHWKNFVKLKQSFDETEELLMCEGDDTSMKELIKGELAELQSGLENLEISMKAELLKPDAEDESSAILEVRAGTGGDEAALFSAELFSMYERYADLNNWDFDIITRSEDGPGALREGVAKIEGTGVFGKLKWESGVHRVQRIPATESQGRIHTSTSTVAIMPHSTDAATKIHIPEKDLRIDVYRSSGAGGQNANKTNSAVRVVHIPTGMMVCIQEERNQQQNRVRALAILQTRLLQLQRKSAESERQKLRQGQIGNAERSDKIRTYNFPQGRITDHRANHSIYCVDEFMRNAEGLDQLIERLRLQEEASKIEQLENE